MAVSNSQKVAGHDCAKTREAAGRRPSVLVRLAASGPDSGQAATGGRGRPAAVRRRQVTHPTRRSAARQTDMSPVNTLRSAVGGSTDRQSSRQGDRQAGGARLRSADMCDRSASSPASSKQPDSRRVASRHESEQAGDRQACYGQTSF